MQQQPEQPSPEEEKLTSELANDRPTIDAAVKSFVSLVSARSLTATATDATTTSVLLGIVNNSANNESTNTHPATTQQQILQLARAILKAVNSFQFSLQDTMAATMAEKPKQKPSRFLGRRALKLAWLTIDIASSSLPPAQGVEKPVDVAIRERQLQWLQEFETLLFRDVQKLPANIQEEDDDSALLWSPDKGAAELSKRRQRRKLAAQERGPSTPS
ncbi:hypothetical protein IV203_016969 [Nitzschia inconspicua]|uniref:Uncharacterized protein n=1 Tax=Nitzschia inconspicua TaxID=303405 RepID=A0A9K3K6I0_9STRA|nr:hypothetical protein IV203_017518 [Nitzschia inconspicua]KAG7348264.1 hypothetical protein IV203_016969 [Nitzschia inconspicua]